LAKILQIRDMAKCIGCYSCMLACARVVRHSFTPAKAALQIRTAGGFQGRFLGEICLGCPDAPCAQVCNSGALELRPGGGLRFSAAKCTGCRACIGACIVQVLHFDQESRQPLACIQCGTCARFCPHGILAMEERKYANTSD